MAKGSRRGGRVRDKWKDKKWIIVNSPSAFGNSPVNYVPITDVNGAQGRIIENTLYDFYKQDPTQHQTKVYLQIDKITGNTASTIFKGHEYAKEFLRSLVRRGSSMINLVKDYTTLDGHVFRIAVVAFSQRRINTSKKHEIRLCLDKLLVERIPKLTLDQFVKEITVGSLSKDLLNEARKIASIRHLGIKKTKLISSKDVVFIKPDEELSAEEKEEEEEEEVVEAENDFIETEEDYENENKEAAAAS